MSYEKKTMMRIVAMPCNTNPNGDIFGGWILSQMDLAGYTACKDFYPGRYVTIAINDTVFKQPIFVGDILTIYTKIVDIGRTSITIEICTYLDRINSPATKQNDIIVTEGIFKYVHINDERYPIPIPEKIKKYGDL
jgi:acyl-CoA thioesterase YciA